MSSNKLSFLTDRIIPEFIRDNHAGFTTLIQSFFEYLERDLGEYDAVANLLSYRDIDTTVDAFIDEFRKEFGHQLPKNTSANIKLIIKQIREFYQSKGSEDAFKFLFRAVYNSSAEFYYPASDMLKTSTAEGKLSDVNSHLTDSDYWQDFSYELSTGVSGHLYENLLYAMAHPAGLKHFGIVKPDPSNKIVTLALVEAILCLIWVDDLATNAVPTPVDSLIKRFFIAYGNGPRDSSGTFLWDRETYQRNLLQDFEETNMSELDGKSGEQNALVFYGRKKQDMNSLKVTERVLELFAPNANTTLGWDGIPGSNTFTTNPNWYLTPLRNQPTVVNDLVTVINMPVGICGNSYQATNSTQFDVPAGVASADDVLLFSEGQKIHSSDVTLGAPDADGIRLATIANASSYAFVADSNIEQHIIEHTSEEHAISVIGDLAITLTGAPVSNLKSNLQVFSEGVFLYPSEYSLAGGVLTIISSLFGGTVSAGDRVEIIFFNRTVNQNIVIHKAESNQLLFNINHNVEKRKWAHTGDSVKKGPSGECSVLGKTSDWFVGLRKDGNVIYTSRTTNKYPLHAGTPTILTQYTDAQPEYTSPPKQFLPMYSNGSDGMLVLLEDGTLWAASTATHIGAHGTNLSATTGDLVQCSFSTSWPTVAGVITGVDKIVSNSVPDASGNLCIAALLTDGTVWMTGQVDNYKTNTIATTNLADVFVEVYDAAGVDHATDIAMIDASAAGTDYTLYIATAADAGDAPSDMLVIGDNDYFQYGDGTTTESKTTFTAINSSPDGLSNVTPTKLIGQRGGCFVIFNREIFFVGKNQSTECSEYVGGLIPDNTDATELKLVYTMEQIADNKAQYHQMNNTVKPEYRMAMDNTGTVYRPTGISGAWEPQGYQAHQVAGHGSNFTYGTKDNTVQWATAQNNIFEAGSTSTTPLKDAAIIIGGIDLESRL